MKCCIYSRVYNENPYLSFFIEHYINLGFTKFIFLKADNESYYIHEEYKDCVEFIDINNLPNEEELLVNSEHILSLNYDWVFGCDIDEFLILNNKYKSIQDFITEKLKINNYINTFYFRWGLTYKMDNNIINLDSLLNKYTIFKNKNIKSMVKISNMIAMVHPHHFKLNEKDIIYFENEVKIFDNLMHEINENYSYEEVFLLHIYVRSINNLFIKFLDNGKIWNIKNYYTFNLDQFNNKFLSKSTKYFLTFDELIKNTGNRAIELIKDNSNNILNFNKDKFLLFNNKFNIFNY